MWRTNLATHQTSGQCSDGMGRQITPAPVVLFEFKHTALALRVITLRAQAIRKLLYESLLFEFKHTVLALRVMITPRAEFLRQALGALRVI